MRRVHVLMLAGGLLLIGIGIFLMLNANDAPEASDEPETVVVTKQYSSEAHSITFSYPAEMQVATLTDKDAADKLLFLASKTSDMPYQLSLRYEDGLTIVAQSAQTPLVEVLLDNLAKQYPKRYAGYKEEKVEKLEIDGKEAAEVIFTYDSPEGQDRIKQVLTIIIDSRDKAYYLSWQSKETDFYKLTEQREVTLNSTKL